MLQADVVLSSSSLCFQNRRNPAESPFQNRESISPIYCLFRLFCFVSLLLSASIFVHVSSFFCFFGDAAFSEYFCIITVFSLYGEYVVRFSLLGGVFLPCDHGLDFGRQLIM